MLKKFVLHKTAVRGACAESAPVSSLPMDRWQQLRLQLRLWWERFVRLGRRAPRRLRLCESLPLGERRFVAVVEFERARFLVGGTTSSLVLLAHLGNGRAQDGKDVEQEEVQDKEKNERTDTDKDNEKHGIIAADRVATEASGSVQP
jgi:hypothetical protein